MEIEKKYLVKQIPSDLENYDYKEITQNYISLDPVIRIRETEKKFFLTVKGKGHIAREEFELELTKDQYLTLSNKTKNNTIKKTRYFIPLENSLTAELDIYHDNLENLITVEVEFNSLKEAELFIPPNWFGEDVSQNKRYKNSFLSTYGISNNLIL